MNKKPGQPPIITEHDKRITALIEAFLKSAQVPKVLDLGDFELANVEVLAGIARGIKDVLWDQKSDTPIKVIFPKNLDLEQFRFFRDSFFAKDRPNVRITTLVFKGIVPGTKTGDKAGDILLPFTDTPSQYTKVLTHLGFNKNKLPKNDSDTDEALEILQDINHAVRRNMENEDERNKCRNKGKEIRNLQINFEIGTDTLQYRLTELLLSLPLHKGDDVQKVKDKLLTYELLGFIFRHRNEILNNQNILVEKVKEVLNRTDRNSSLNQKLRDVTGIKEGVTVISTPKPSINVRKKDEAEAWTEAGKEAGALKEAEARKIDARALKAEPRKSFASRVLAGLKALLPSERDKKKKLEKKKEKSHSAKTALQAEYRTMIATKRADAAWAKVQAERKRRQTEVMDAGEKLRQERLQGQAHEMQDKSEFHPGKPLMLQANQIHAARKEADAAKYASLARQVQVKEQFKAQQPQAKTTTTSTITSTANPTVPDEHRDLVDLKMTMLNTLQIFINTEQAQQNHWYAAFIYPGRQRQIDLGLEILPLIAKAKDISEMKDILSNSMLKLKPGVPLYDILEEGLKVGRKLKP